MPTTDPSDQSLVVEGLLFKFSVKFLSRTTQRFIVGRATGYIARTLSDNVDTISYCDSTLSIFMTFSEFCPCPLCSSPLPQSLILQHLWANPQINFLAGACSYTKVSPDFANTWFRWTIPVLQRLYANFPVLIPWLNPTMSQTEMFASSISSHLFHPYTSALQPITTAPRLTTSPEGGSPV